jgi:mannose/fructose-specific phosphotransferase system component IIA
MSEAQRTHVRGVLVAHGEMARGMVDAVRKISGLAQDRLVPLSNEGRSPERLRSELAELLGSGPAIVFTDLQAGSCALAALATGGGEHTVVICGVNLPMLLDFAFHPDLPLDELADRLVTKGREGIRRLPAVGSARAPRAARSGS